VSDHVVDRKLVFGYLLFDIYRNCNDVQFATSGNYATGDFTSVGDQYATNARLPIIVERHRRNKEIRDLVRNLIHVWSRHCINHIRRSVDMISQPKIARYKRLCVVACDIATKVRYIARLSI
jgi:hypothetical protein